MIVNVKSQCDAMQDDVCFIKSVAQQERGRDKVVQVSRVDK